MFPEKVADMTPEQRKAWDKLQEQAEIKRQYKLAGKLGEWEKKREKSPALKEEAPA